MGVLTPLFAFLCGDDEPPRTTRIVAGACFGALVMTPRCRQAYLSATRFYLTHMIWDPFRVYGGWLRRTAGGVPKSTALVGGAKMCCGAVVGAALMNLYPPSVQEES